MKYFLAIAETGSFSRAAERCHVSQPSLSQQIIKLEQELGHPLFDRTGRGVLLTEAGRRLVDHARTVLMTVENATRELRDVRQGARGRIAVGVIPTIAPYLLPTAIAAFIKANPNVELILQEDYTPRLIHSLCEGELDVGIMAAPIKHEQLMVEVLGADPLLLVLPSEHKLARKRRIKLDDVRDEPFVLISDVHCLGEQVVSFCRRHELQPRVVCRSAQVSTVQALVGLGQGISLLPGMARDADRSSRRVYRELSDDKPARTIVAVRHRHRYQTPQVQQFLAVVKPHLRKQ